MSNVCATMGYRVQCAVVACLLGLGTSAAARASGEADSSPGSLLPDRALVRVVAPAPGVLLDALANQPMLEHLRNIPGDLALALAHLDRQLADFESKLTAIDPATEHRTRVLLEQLAGAGISLWIDIKGLKPDFGIVMRSENPMVAREALQLLLNAVAREYGAPRAFESVTAHRDGVDIWELGEDIAVGWRDGIAVVTANSKAALDCLNRRSPESDPRGGWTPNSPDNEVHARVDLKRARLIAAISGDDGLSQLSQLPNTPKGQLLFGSSLSTTALGDSVELWLRADSTGLEFELTSEGGTVVGPTPTTAFLEPRRGDVVFAHLARRPEVLVDGSLVLGDAANAQLAKFLSEFELLTGDFDMRRDVLPALGPNMYVIARDIPFSSGPRPELRWPAIGLVIETRDDAQLGETFIAAFQTAIALRNVEAAEAGRTRPFLLHRTEVGDGRGITVAHYRRPAEGEPIDMIYNWAPGCAVLPGWFVIASHEDLLLELLADLGAAEVASNGGQRGSASANEHLVLDGTAAMQLLKTQRDAVELSMVLKDGVSSADATQAVDSLMELMAVQSRFLAELTPSPAGGVTLKLRLETAGNER